MHKIRFRPGLRPRPRWESSYSGLPDLPAGFKRSYFYKEREGGEDRAGEEKGQKGEGGQEGNDRREEGGDKSPAWSFQNLGSTAENIINVFSSSSSSSSSAS